MRKPFLLLLFLFFAVALGYLNRSFLQELYLQKFYPWLVRGEVKDITNGSPLELAEIIVGDRRTFTTYKGEFTLKNVQRVGEVYLVSPDGYEAYTQPLSCRVAPTGNRARELVCQAFLYPTAETTAVRVETAFFPIGAEVGGDIEARYHTLWKLLAPESQKLFRNEKYFVDLLVIKDLIQRKLETNTVSFRLLPDKTQELGAFTDPLTGVVYPAVVETVAERKLADGQQLTVTHRLVKVEGIWRYLADFTEKDVENYNNRNGWVLKVKN